MNKKTKVIPVGILVSKSTKIVLCPDCGIKVEVPIRSQIAYCDTHAAIRQGKGRKKLEKWDTKIVFCNDCGIKVEVPIHSQVAYCLPHQGKREKAGKKLSG